MVKLIEIGGAEVQTYSRQGIETHVTGNHYVSSERCTSRERVALQKKGAQTKKNEKQRERS